MNRIPKNILIIVIILFLLVSVSNYSKSSQSIDEITYVMAIGIDVGTTAQYKISLQLSNVESSSSESIGSSSGSSSSSGSQGSSSGGNSSPENTPSYIIDTIETDSIDSAINIANSFVDKNINLSHCKILVISEELAKKGVENIINTLINKVEIRPDCNIIISRIPLNEFSDSSTPKMEEFLSKYYDLSSNAKTQSGYTEEIKLNDFYSDLNDLFCQPYATLGSISNSKKNVSTDKNNKTLDSQARSLISNDSELSIETMGLAVFKSDKLVGSLTSIETMCHLLVGNNLRHCTLNIPSPFNSDETIDIYISTLKNSKINVKIINGSPFVTSNFDISTKVLSFNGNEENILTENKLKIIQEATINYLTEQLYNYFNKTAKEFNSDISGIGRYAVKEFKNLDEWEKYNWLENYQNSTFKVNVQLNIKSGYF